MNRTQNSASLQYLGMQLLANFVLPIFVLTKLSTTLGPIKALLLALAFPFVFEAYNIVKKRKISLVSVIAIAGLLITGALGMLEVSNFWLAVRRSVVYLFIAVLIIGSEIIKKPLLETFLNQVLDTAKIQKAAQANRTVKQVKLLYRRVSIAGAAVFIAIAAISFTLTRIIVTTVPPSTLYNEETAKLRLYSIPFITIPLILVVVILLVYLFSRLEKLTGLEVDQMTSASLNSDRTQKAS